MLPKRLVSMKKLARKLKSTTNVVDFSGEPRWRRYECLHSSDHRTISMTGTFVVYVGEDRRRFTVPMNYLSHPLFKILLDKAYDEFGFDQQNGLVFPCSVAAFQEVITAVECCNGMFEFGELVENLKIF
ncbi:protein SMALL AUXIN UP-REGULATED RNA 54-like [Andrographis paniculata]|uniref:protein SMALL AUXIN UP-REGULATED RNA 54-like n=1 Tax=Andrographis paniculata TaxID=175694 RepID=UPI0021E8D612|nr:protein SMALL AUXIN UP-REGULATED RNA 54-like [Andrographis paniculata]